MNGKILAVYPEQMMKDRHFDTNVEGFKVNGVAEGTMLLMACNECTQPSTTISTNPDGTRNKLPDEHVTWIEFTKFEVDYDRANPNSDMPRINALKKYGDAFRQNPKCCPKCGK